jgi:hypothetical protein
MNNPIMLLDGNQAFSDAFSHSDVYPAAAPGISLSSADLVLTGIWGRAADSDAGAPVTPDQ